VIDLKLSGIIGIGALLLSFLTGTLSGAGFPMTLIRALVFGVLFFGLSGAVQWLIRRFIPELLNGEEPEKDEFDFEASPGSRVNISVGEGDGVSSGIGAFPPDTDDVDSLENPEHARADGSGPEPLNPDDPGGEGAIPQDFAGEGFPGMDQHDEDGYTKEGMVNESPGVSTKGPEPDPAIPGEIAGIGEDFAGIAGENFDEIFAGSVLDPLPDMEALSGAFKSSQEDDGQAEEPPVLDSPEPKRSGRKNQALPGDFNAEELAAGLRTVLAKDKKG
jgi:hypothetical protein